MKRLIAVLVVSCLVAGMIQAGVVIDDILHVKLSTPSRLPNSAQWTSEGSFIIADDVTTMGVAGQYSPMQDFSINLSLALFDPDNGSVDEGYTIQGGAGYKFYSNGFDLIGRGGLALPFHDDIDMWMLHGDVLGRISINAVPGLMPYASIGLAFYDYDIDKGASDDGIEPTIGIGAEYSFANQFTCRAGVEYLDTTAFSLGFGIVF
ncbi:outer membrane beta-barrel protein [PVC group bacterium]|nr:outer membrane beta-barrel protein [PVC group bacterium]